MTPLWRQASISDDHNTMSNEMLLGVTPVNNSTDVYRNVTGDKETGASVVALNIK